MPKIAVSYIRFSTKSQIRGDSLDRQLAGARDYAKRHGLKLNESSFQDLGISAFRGKNATEGRLKAFLDACDDGSLGDPNDVILLIESFDRLSRGEVTDALDLFLAITRRGITIVTLTDEQVYSRETISENWTKLIISLATMARAHEESLTKSRRVRSGKAKALDRGFKHGKVPMWLTQNDDKRTLRIIEDRADVVREVFKKRADGIGSLRIAQWLNENHGYRWGSPQAARLLQNPAVIGTRLSQASYEPLLEYYPAIITKTLFYEVQRLMSSASKGTRAGRTALDQPNLFTGLLRCGQCGASMRFFRPSKTVTQQYVKCHDAVVKLNCDAGYVNYDALEADLIGWLLMDQNEEIVEILEKKPARKKAIHGAEVQTLKEQRNNLVELMMKGLVNPTYVAEKLNNIELQIKDHESGMVEESIPDDDERLPAEKAWTLAVNLQDATLGDDPVALANIRSEIKVAFQKAIRVIRVPPEVRTDHEITVHLEVEFNGYDAVVQHQYKRRALRHVKGVYNVTPQTPIDTASDKFIGVTE